MEICLSETEVFQSKHITVAFIIPKYPLNYATMLESYTVLNEAFQILAQRKKRPPSVVCSSIQLPLNSKRAEGQTRLGKREKGGGGY